ncbi:MAG: bifunctional DNA-formamidopyrimidine glycosylase/DNA-(apurinic or apyrimidinic site) lyase [Bacillota bacterium]
MPELPEVETVRRSLLGKIEDQSIFQVDVLHPKVVEPLSAEQFGAMVQHKRISCLRRRGKYLLVDLRPQGLLLIHLRMTGRLALVDPDLPRPKHTHVVLHLSSGKELRFIDPRRFGQVRYLADEESVDAGGFAQLGVEPLSDEFTTDYLYSVTRRRRVAIKGLLLNQAVVAGLGNIYVDEALFEASIDPECVAGELTREQIERLVTAIRHVIAEGIANRGSSFRDYVDAQGERGSYQELWRVYAREGEPCTRCGTTIIRKRVAGRSSHVCPNCQKGER